MSRQPKYRCCYRNCITPTGATPTDAPLSMHYYYLPPPNRYNNNVARLKTTHPKTTVLRACNSTSATTQKNFSWYCGKRELMPICRVLSDGHQQTYTDRFECFQRKCCSANVFVLSSLLTPALRIRAVVPMIGNERS